MYIFFSELSSASVDSFTELSFFFCKSLKKKFWMHEKFKKSPLPPKSNKKKIQMPSQNQTPKCIETDIRYFIYKLTLLRVFQENPSFNQLFSRFSHRYFSL